MSTGSKRSTFGGTSALGAILLCTLVTTSAVGATGPGQKKSKTKKPTQPVVQLPSGPTGPVQAIPLDNIAAVPPQVTYQDNQLTIVAPNSTLADILRAVHKQTGAEIEIPSAPDRVVTRLGPGPARDVIADLLNGSRFNYILLGFPEDANALTRVVLVAKSGVQDVTPNVNVADAQPAFQTNQHQPSQIVSSPMPEESPEGNEAEAQEQEDNNGESAGEDNGDQAAEAEQQQNPPQDQQGVKTPQQMLQEMQQRQMQLQQQQPPGQPPIPGSGMPPHPPQQN